MSHFLFIVLVKLTHFQSDAKISNAKAIVASARFPASNFVSWSSAECQRHVAPAAQLAELLNSQSWYNRFRINTLI